MYGESNTVTQVLLDVRKKNGLEKTMLTVERGTILYRTLNFGHKWISLFL